MNRNKQESTTRFIDPNVLSRISNLELLARGVVEGFISGLHKSPYKGFSVEFLEYRPYTPGDDPWHIDWKLYMRSDRLFIKQFEDETNTTCHIMLDVSHSMDYTSTKTTKFRFGILLTATLCYFMIRQRDSVGISFFDDQIRERIPAKSTRGHLHSILQSLDRVSPGSVSDMGKPLHELADSIKRRGIVVIISDLLDDPEKIIDGLKHFRFNGNNVIVFQIMDPFELSFELSDIVEIEDMETEEKILIMGDEAKERYHHNLNIFRSTMERECGHLGVDYNLLETDKPLDYALFKYLSQRGLKR